MKPISPTVMFVDHSVREPATQSSSSSRKRGLDELGIELPSPTLIRLHAALTHVMHLSAAAEIFEDLKNLPGAGGEGLRADDGGAGFVEKVVEGRFWRLRESIEAMQIDHGHLRVD